jgi:hypothetical protein
MKCILCVKAASAACECTVRVPAWYTLPKISFLQFCTLAKPLYDVLEDTKTSKSEEDAVSKQCWMSYFSQSEAEWNAMNLRIQKQRAWTMAMGNFHQSLMGSFPGMVNYKTGHATGCDIGSADGTLVCEIKNNKNTMNSDSKKSVMLKLKAQRDLGKQCKLVIVNGDIRKKREEDIEWVSGREFYAELSGSETFMHDLVLTLGVLFREHKTWKSLLQRLRTLESAPPSQTRV